MRKQELVVWSKLQKLQLAVVSHSACIQTHNYYHHNRGNPHLHNQNLHHYQNYKVNKNVTQPCTPPRQGYFLFSQRCRLPRSTLQYPRFQLKPWQESTKNKTSSVLTSKVSCSFLATNSEIIKSRCNCIQEPWGCLLLSLRCSQVQEKGPREKSKLFVNLLMCQFQKVWWDPKKKIVFLYIAMAEKKTLLSGSG